MKKMDFIFRGMRSLFSRLLISLIFVCSLSAQISLVSSFPADGATSVDTASTLSLTFNQPVDVSANFEGLDMDEGFFLGLQLFPLGKSGEPDSITFSFDFKTVYFHNFHLWAETKYVVMLLGAKAACGDSLDKPYVINFTTGASLPTNTVSGTVAYAGDPTNSFVSLLSLETGGEGPNFLASTVVSSPSGFYTIPYVETGDYGGLAILDANLDGNFDPATDPLGWYDPDLNGVPDTLKVTGSMSGVNIVMGALVPQTAQGLLIGVDASVKSTVPDAELVIIMGDELNLDGKAVQWKYVYFSNSASKFYTVSTLGTSILPMAEKEEAQFPTESLPANWIDSDSALTVAEVNGGSNFRTIYPNATISAVLFPASAAGFFSVDKTSYSRDKLCWKLNPKNLMKEDSFLQGQILWKIEYNSDTAGEDTTIYLDAVTGVVTGVESEKVGTGVPSSFKLRQNYPNPFNPVTIINYSIPKTSWVIINIYDVLGREIKKIVNEEKIAGNYKIEFNANGLANGIYLYRMQVGSFVETKKLILLK